MRLVSLIVVFLVLMALQVMAAREAFASSQGGALIQLKASHTEQFASSQGGAQVQLKSSRPMYYLGLQ